MKSGIYKRQSYFKVFSPYLFIIAVYTIAYYFGFLKEAFLLWLIPSFFGVIITVYVFDHLPHHPHADTGKYTNARTYPHPILDKVFFMHSYHIVHHLWPSIPWYLYKSVYEDKRSELQAAGNIEVKLF
jgi:beta-carotene hydroxylase